MGTYLSPGVYIEEQDTGPEPIEGVSTSVTGFVGVTQSGPLDTNPPVPVTSLPEYQRTFGSYFTPAFSGSAPSGDGDSYNFMPHAVAGFFNNGGQLLYIKRVASAATPPTIASVSGAVTNLENTVTASTPTIMTRLTSTAVPGSMTIQVTNTRGIQNGSTIKLTQVKNGVTSTSGAIVVSSCNDQQKTLTLVDPLPTPAPAAANYDWQYTTVAVTAGAAFVPESNTSNFLLAAANPGSWGNTVQTGGGTGVVVQITPSSRTQGQVIGVGNVSPGTNNLIVLNSGSNFYAGAILEFSTGGTSQVQGSVTGVKAFFPGEQVEQVSEVATATLVGTVTGSNPMTITGPSATGDSSDPWIGQSSSAVYTPAAAPVSMFAVNGSVTSGVFVAGEQVVQTNSGATATLIGTVTSSNPMIIGPLTAGTADPSDTWTGQTSGAVFTPGPAPAPPVAMYAVAGSVFSGIFSAGEEVTQTSGATANLIGTVLGPNDMIIGPLTAGVASPTEHWTGKVSGATYAPNNVLPAAMYAVTGSVTKGTFTANEALGQFSTATATLIGPVPTAGPMTIGPITGGTGDSLNPWTGESSGATFTPTSIPSSEGKFYAKAQAITGSGVQLFSPLSTAQAAAINSNLNATPALPVVVRTCEFDINDSYGNVSESFRGLTLDNTTPYYFATAIVNGSTLLSVPYLTGVLPPTLPSDNFTQDPRYMPVAPDGVNVLLSGGTDGAYPQSSDFVGIDGGPGNRTGIAALIDAAEISIIATPGITDQTTQMGLISQCETVSNYRFAILDPAPTPTGGTPSLTDIQNQRNLYDTYYAAIYYPRLMVTDPLSGNPLAIPPSGHIAGIYAQTDATRGVWKAPANVVINGILSFEIKLSKGDQDILNPEPNNINALRDFTAQGRGLRVYGARCITSDTEWMYVPVRRTFIFLESSLDQGTQWAVFEPNDQQLWNRLIQSVSNFLTTIWQQGGLMGATADQAFFVKCGLDTMSTDDIENGRLIMLVGVAPVFPAEFVIIRIGQWAGGSSVQEL
jgi:phage tail sheath protein FI